MQQPNNLKAIGDAFSEEIIKYLAFKCALASFRADLGAREELSWQSKNKMTQLSSEVDINSTLANELLAELSPELNLNSTLAPELHAELISELNINTRLPPELLTKILYFLPLADLNNALLVCRSTKYKHRKNCECCPVSLLIVR